MTTKWNRLLRGWGGHELGVGVATVLLAAIITAVNPQFLTLENVFDLLSNYAFLGILSVGLFVVLVSGGIDISFVATATVAQYVMAVVIIRYGGNMPVAFLIAASAGALLGLVNALLVYYLQMPSIVATIATLNVFYGLLIAFSRGRWIYNLPPWFKAFGDLKVIRLLREDGTSYGLSVMAVIFLAVVVVTGLFLKYTTLGRKICALGGNATAAARAGFGILKIQIVVYGYMGLLAGVAGMVHTLDVQTVAPNALVGKELSVVAAVVLGGASLSGGAGTVRGTVLGVALVAIMSNGLTLMRVPSVWNEAVIGLVILISVTLNARRAKKRRAPGCNDE